jgi:hypothetical protein
MHWIDLIVHKILDWFRTAVHFMSVLLILSALALFVFWRWPQIGGADFRPFAMIGLLLSFAYLITYPIFGDTWRKKRKRLNHLAQNEKAALKVFLDKNVSVTYLIASEDTGTGATSLIADGILFRAKAQTEMWEPRGLLWCQIPNRILIYLRHNPHLLS